MYVFKGAAPAVHAGEEKLVCAGVPTLGKHMGKQCGDVWEDNAHWCMMIDGCTLKTGRQDCTETWTLRIQRAYAKDPESDWISDANDWAIGAGCQLEVAHKPGLARRCGCSSKTSSELAATAIRGAPAPLHLPTLTPLYPSSPTPTMFAKP